MPVDHFKQALAYGQDKAFDEAIRELTLVDASDANYDAAQAKLVEYRRYKAQAELSIERAKLAENIQAAKKTKLRLKQIEKSPDSHIGHFVAWRGQVMQISEQEGFTRAQISYYERGYTNDNFFVEMPGSVDIYADDFVIVYGRFHHMESYTSQANYQITSPYISGIHMKKIAPLSPF